MFASIEVPAECKNILGLKRVKFAEVNRRVIYIRRFNAQIATCVLQFFYFSFGFRLGLLEDARFAAILQTKMCTA